jgi:hypothetical protein
VTAPDATHAPASNATANATTTGTPCEQRVGGLPEWIKDESPYLIRGAIHALIGHPKKDVHTVSGFISVTRRCNSCLGYFA